MSKHQTVAATWMVAVVDQLVSRGLPREELVEAAWRRGPLPSSPSQQLELITVRRLWHRAAELSSDPLLGVKVGASLPPQTLNVLALLIMHCADLRTALQNLGRFVELISNSGHFAPHATPAGMVVRYTATDCYLPMHPMQLDSIMANWLAHVRFGGGPAMRPACVRLPAFGRVDAARYATRYSEALDCPVEFHQEAGADIVYTKSALDARFPGADARLYELLRSHAEAMRRNMGTADSLVTSIRAAAREMRFNNVTCAHVAREIGLSSRTLQRRLTETGKTFRGLIEGVRMEEALHLLGTSQLSLHEISDRLGYSEPSSFSHAVRSYWGATPRELRARNLRGRMTGCVDCDAESAPCLQTG